MKTDDHIIINSLGIIIYLGTHALADRDICEVNGHGPYYTYCDDGYYCCGNNTQCCAKGLSAGPVIGIVFGILFVLGVCMFCFVFITKKTKRPNRLVRPQNQQNCNVSTLGGTPQLLHQGFSMDGQRHTYPAWGQPYYPYNPGQPDPYCQFSVTTPQPPPYSQNDLAPPPAYKYEP